MKRILLNALFLFVSDVLVRFITATATILVARYLNPETYGALNVALAFAAIAGFLTDAGLTHTVMREATRPGANVAVVVASVFRLRLALAAGTTILTLLLVRVGYHDPIVKQSIILLALPALWGGVLTGISVSYFQANQEMQYVALIRIVSGLISAAFLATAVMLRWPYTSIVATYGAAYVASGLIGMRLTRARIPVLSGWDPGVLKGLGSFALSGILGLILPQLGPLILEKVSGLTDVGYFSVAYKIPNLLYSIPSVVAVAFYPALFSLWATDKQEHHRMVRRELKVMSALGFGLPLPIMAYAENIIDLVFGPTWIASTVPLRILSCMVAFQALSIVMGDALTTQDLQGRRTVGYALSTLAGVLSHFFLGTHYGAMGAAFASVLVQTVMLIAFTTANPTGWSLLIAGIRHPLASLLVSLLVGLVMHRWISWLLGVPIIVAVYAGMLWALDPEVREIPGLAVALIHRRMRGG